MTYSHTPTNQLSQERARELFDYKDGKLFWKVRKAKNTKIDSVAGGLNKITGYWQVGVDGKRYRSHVLIWNFHHGPVPAGKCIDHVDGDPSNNRIENLNPVTHQQNLQKQKKQSSNTSGHTNIHWHEQNKKWRLRLKNPKTGNDTHFGCFKNIKKAIKKRDAIRKKWGLPKAPD